VSAAAHAAMAIAEPILRWSARAHSIAEIEQELARIWARQDLAVEVEGTRSRHVAARTSVMNLVVIARTWEIGERGAATIQALTGRHPSRVIVVQSADPDGPSWIDARVEAHCILPRADAPETCAETIHLTAGGEAGHHLSAIVTPLIIHDLPVAIWWPGEPPIRSPATLDLLAGADRLIVDGSTWSGDGLIRLREMAHLLDTTRLAISDFALVRQSRWREAIASIFDDPDFLPYLRSIRRIAVTYATHDETGAPGSTNLVKPVYHVAWLASRLGFHVRTPLHPVTERGAATTATRARTAPARSKPGARPVPGRGMAATLTDGHGEVGVVVRPVVSPMPPGTTLRVELLAERRGSELRADVTAEAETVHVHVWQDGVQVLDRSFLAARRSDVDLLAEAIETGTRDVVAIGTLRSAAHLVRAPEHASAPEAPSGHGDEATG
jgi:glucose-6-phosphate dehydrogenase assembly protein OpcA